MKNFKIAFWLVLTVLLVLVFFQNKEFLLGKQELILNLGVIDVMHGSLPIVVWFLVALCIGFLVAYFFALIEKFKTKKVVKALKAQADAQAEMISQMKNELENRTGYQANDMLNAQPPADISGRDLDKV